MRRAKWGEEPWTVGNYFFRINHTNASLLNIFKGKHVRRSEPRCDLFNLQRQGDQNG